MQTTYCVGEITEQGAVAPCSVPPFDGMGKNPLSFVCVLFCFCALV